MSPINGDHPYHYGQRVTTPAELMRALELTITQRDRAVRALAAIIRGLEGRIDDGPGALLLDEPWVQEVLDD